MFHPLADPNLRAELFSHNVGLVASTFSAHEPRQDIERQNGHSVKLRKPLGLSVEGTFLVSGLKGKSEKRANTTQNFFGVLSEKKRKEAFVPHVLPVWSEAVLPIQKPRNRPRLLGSVPGPI